MLGCHGFRPIAADQKYATAVYSFRYDFEAAFYAVHLRLPSRLNLREIPAFRVTCNISVRHSPCKTVLWHCASATGQMAHDRNPTLLVKQYMENQVCHKGAFPLCYQPEIQGCG